MTTGAHRAEALPQDGIHAADLEDRHSEFATDIESGWGEPVPEEAPRRGWILASLLGALAIAWIAAASWSAVDSGAPLTLPSLLPFAALASGPLALLGILWLAFGRTPRREAERFTRAVATMRSESAALEAMLATVAARLEENQARLGGEAAKLMALGDEASDRLGRVTHFLARESATLDRKAEALEAAAAAARIDIGVLLEDLPRAEQQARSLAGAMQESGLTAHQQAGALEGQMSALIARGREADEVVGGAAQRLAAHLARIESSSGNAATRMDDAAARMAATIDGTMDRAALAVDAARSGIEEQAGAVLAMIEQSRAAFERAGEDTGRSLSHRLAEIEGQVKTLAGALATQDSTGQAMAAALARSLAEIDEQLAALGQTGHGASQLLTNALAELQGSVERLQGQLGEGQARADDLIGRSRTLAEGFASVAAELDGPLPLLLTRVEEKAARTRETAGAIRPEIEAVRASAESAGATLAEAETGIARQTEALQAMLAIIEAGVRAAEQRLQALAEAIGSADEASARIANETSPELIEAMARVRETANQAAERAREAIAAVIPQSTARLAEASRLAVGEAITGQVVEQMGELSVVAERAVDVARKASERLTRQMLSLAESAAAVEERIDAGRRAHEEREADNFSRRVALLIDALNSTAIDVTKILSNEVTDGAWAAYLKGDRGVFTRRAVRLLDNAEVREIVQHYDSEPDFRDQVNRYIHDFEAMLGRVLADREGSTLGVTLLSSDMGKLYVALAQAIERLRA